MLQVKTNKQPLNTSSVDKYESCLADKRDIMWLHIILHSIYDLLPECLIFKTNAGAKLSTDLAVTSYKTPSVNLTPQFK